MTFDKVTCVCLISCTAAGVVAGYRLHTPPPAVPAIQQTVQTKTTADRVIQTVTKFISVPSPTAAAPTRVIRVPQTVTRTVIEKPQEVQNVSSAVVPATASARYSLGLGCVHFPCGSVGSFELQGSVRLWSTPVSVYTSFQPVANRIAVGVRYDF